MAGKFYSDKADNLITDYKGGATVEELEQKYYFSRSYVLKLVRVYEKALKNDKEYIEKVLPDGALKEWAKGYLPKEQPKQEQMEMAITDADNDIIHEGDKVKHIFFGVGEVVYLDGKFIKVKFANDEIKMFLKNEVAKNGVLTKMVEVKAKTDKELVVEHLKAIIGLLEKEDEQCT